MGEHAGNQSEKSFEQLQKNAQNNNDVVELNGKILAEIYDSSGSSQAQAGSRALDSANSPLQRSGSGLDLPGLILVAGEQENAGAKKQGSDKAEAGSEKSSRESAVQEIVLPWTPDPNGRLKMHMSYGQSKDAIVSLGEGPFHVAKRLLGKDAADADVKAFSDALKEQFKQDESASDLSSLRNGHKLLTEENIAEVLSRIADRQSRERITERLKEGWTDREPPVAVPFKGHNRPGETNPDRIEDADQFLKDLADAAIKVGADKLRAKGLCAQGARLAFNTLPLWRIDGGSVDKSINKDINGWRSGITLALDLGETGLFDIVPLKELGYKNLKEGYVLGRYHYPDYVKQRPKWEGEDFGDIDIVTKRHMPPNDDSKMYRDSFVLIPKKDQLRAELANRKS